MLTTIRSIGAPNPTNMIINTTVEKESYPGLPYPTIADLKNITLIICLSKEFKQFTQIYTLFSCEIVIKPIISGM